MDLYLWILSETSSMYVHFLIIAVRFNVDSYNIQLSFILTYILIIIFSYSCDLSFNQPHARAALYFFVI